MSSIFASFEKSGLSKQFQVILFFFSLYLVAIGESGHKPCVQAFGADQFDSEDEEELKMKSSFFNWWYFSLCLGCILAILILNYVQDNLSWSLGFGIPCVIMTVGLVLFLLGTRSYRFSIRRDERNPFARIGRVFVAAVRNMRISKPSAIVEEEGNGMLPKQSSEQFR